MLRLNHNLRFKLLVRGWSTRLILKRDLGSLLWEIEIEVILWLSHRNLLSLLWVIEAIEEFICLSGLTRCLLGALVTLYDSFGEWVVLIR
jgi:hypothetical protein